MREYIAVYRGRPFEVMSLEDAASAFGHTSEKYVQFKAKSINEAKQIAEEKRKEQWSSSSTIKYVTLDSLFEVKEIRLKK